jgi:hypothetical protein
MTEQRFVAARERDEEQHRIRRGAWIFSVPSMIANTILLLSTSGLMAMLPRSFGDASVGVFMLALLLALFAIPCQLIGAARDFRRADSATRVLVAVLVLLTLLPVVVAGAYLADLSDLS